MRVIKEIVEKFIEEQNLTKRMFCDLCGISLVTLQTLFDGRTPKRPLTVLLKLTTTLNVSCSALLITS